uniref:C3H1-type domain-containing protein n=2 Tax=Vombatus ursinus TaxID=29139 RepID=A0A4X2JPS1_VOMUR
MPKRGKQRPPDPEESGDEESGSPAGPPSLLGPPPIANGKFGGPEPGFHRGPQGLRGPVIPPLLSLPLPFWGGCPMRGGPGPRPRPYLHSRWAYEDPEPRWGTGYGDHARNGPPNGWRNLGGGSSHHPSKNIPWPKNAPQFKDGVQEGDRTDKSNRPVCRHFSKGHCRYEDLCAFYHPGVNGPPL